jgi:hypothetical protein
MMAYGAAIMYVGGLIELFFLVFLDYFNVLLLKIKLIKNCFDVFKIISSTLLNTFRIG